MELSLEGLEENSWATAYDAVRTSLRIPPSLPHIMRACWHDMIDPAEFMRLLGCPGLNTKCLLRAAQLPQLNDPVQAAELQAAVDVLGVKASAVVLAINCICERTLDSGPPNRVWSPLFKDMMSEIELGYHFGSSIERCGYEQGMLVGFSRLAGLAVLLLKFPDQFTKWYLESETPNTPLQTLKIFGCEPYQVSSILMQHLGLGTEVALATASTIGEITSEVVEVRPTMRTWMATYRWLHALKSGLERPECHHSQSAFTELCASPGEARIPEHLAILLEQVEGLRKTPSLWTWHLPLPTYEETAKAIVYRANTNSAGTTWTKGLVLNAQ